MEIYRLLIYNNLDKNKHNNQWRLFMPIVTSTEMFKKAYEGGYAIGAFNVNNMEKYFLY